MKGTILGLLTVGLLAGSLAAQAIPVTYDFTASGFTSLNDGTPGPYDPISGSFDVFAGTLLGFNMTIGTKTYTLSDVGMFNGTLLYGGTGNGTAIASGTDDFNLEWSGLVGLGPLTFVRLVYATEGVNDIWRTRTGTITVRTSVPEPGTLALLGLGLTGLALGRRRRAS